MRWSFCLFRRNRGMKRNLLGFVLMIFIIFLVWSFCEHRSNVADADSTTFIKPLRSLADDKELERRDSLIATLKSELSQFRKDGQDCPGVKGRVVEDLPVIYAITPTYSRAVQKAELTRMSHTLMLVPNLHWIIVEDSEHPTELVSKLLKRTGMAYTHLNAATPKNWKLKTKEPHWSKPRGVIQRNVALDWIRSNLSEKREGVIYFADDDNSYSLELFDEMRWVKTVGVWPVGLVGGVKVERPKVDINGKVVGWLTVWSPNRPFAIDMAGFAINLKRFLSRPNGKFAFEVKKGYQESELLRHFVDSLDELEPKAEGCTKVNVWHTRTEPPNLTQEIALAKARKPPTDKGLEI